MTVQTPDADDQQRALEAAKMEHDRKRRRIGGGIIAVLALGALIYAMTFGESNQSAQACEASTSRLADVRDKASGDVAALIVPDALTALPELGFNGDDGAPLTVADFNGKVILLNLWATWCAPCREEMPALDRLQSTMGSDRFEVVAVNVDTRNPEKARGFLDEIGVTDLTFYADNSMKIFRDLRTYGRAFGMPTTVLIDEAGCELGTMAGPAEWDSRDALELIRAAMGPSS